MANPVSSSMGPLTGSLVLQSQESDKVREIFFLFDREASGKLSDDNFYEALLAGGAKLNESEFKTRVLAEFGSAPTLVVFKQALAKAKSRDESMGTLKARFASFGQTVSVDTLRYLVTFNCREKLSNEECEDLIKLVDPDGTGVVNVDALCHKLMPH